MDFNVNAGAGVLPGAAAALALRGPDPAITIPAHPHFFRRIAGITLAPAVGALVPVPTTLPQSMIELVLGPAVSHNLAAASKSRVSEYCTASVHKERRALLRYGCSVLGTSCAKSLMLGIVHTPSSGQPQRVE